MAKSLIDHVKQIIKKDNIHYFDKLERKDKKSFSSYVVQRFLSMNPDWTTLINFINKYTFVLNDDQYYKLACLLIPNQARTYYPYIKNKNKDKYNKKAIEYIGRYYEISEQQAEEYYEILGKEKIQNIMKKYGISKKKMGKIK